MSAAAARVMSVLAGFAAWAAFARNPSGGFREAWDVPSYWMYGVPTLLVFQGARAALAPGRRWREPLWTAAGHAFAGVVFAKGGASLGLAPLALVVVVAPIYVALACADWIGALIGGRR